MHYSGGFKNISEAALDVECHQPPIRLALEKAVIEAVLRIQTALSYETIRSIRNTNEPQKTADKITKLLSPLEQIEDLAKRT